MSGITGISGYNSSLLPLLSETESGASDSSILDSPISGDLQTTNQDASSSTAATGSSSDLQDQIQSAVAAALQSAEQAGGSDLKGVVYNSLVQVLQENGIDPKTLKPTSSTATGSSSSQQSVSSSTSAILALVLTACAVPAQPVTRWPSLRHRWTTARDRAICLPCSRIPRTAQIQAICCRRSRVLKAAQIPATHCRNSWLWKTTAKDRPICLPCSRPPGARARLRIACFPHPLFLKTTTRTCSGFCTIQGNEQFDNSLNRSTCCVRYQQCQ